MSFEEMSVILVVLGAVALLWELVSPSAATLARLEALTRR
jgi:hypothetical protein